MERIPDASRNAGTCTPSVSAAESVDCELGALMGPCGMSG